MADVEFTWEGSPLSFLHALQEASQAQKPTRKSTVLQAHHKSIPNVVEKVIATKRLRAKTAS